MKKLNLLYIGFAIVFSACSGDKSENTELSGGLDTAVFLTQIKEIDVKLNSGVLDKNDIKKALVLFQDYANHLPKDPKSPSYLLKTSDLYLNLNNPNKAVDVLNNIIELYPNYENLDAVYFNRASHTDFEIRDTTLAKQYYLEFIEKYPNSDFVANAQTRIDQNFMSMEKLVEMFTKNAEKLEAEK